MNTATSTALDGQEQETLKGIADLLAPAYKKMPAASKVNVHTTLAENVLRFRPELLADVKRGLSAMQGAVPAAAINALRQDDTPAYEAVTLVISAGYYMSGEVREALGYPGQVRLTYDPYETADFFTNGMLERVSRRGPIYRMTPK